MLERDIDRYSGKERHEGFFSGLYKRNEHFIILSAALFLSSMFAGYFLSGTIDQIMREVLRSFKESVSRGEIKLTTFSIFINNLKIAFLIYGGGIIFGLGTALILVYNGIFIGYAASQFPIGNFIIYTLPHGIFEITGIIIAGTAGFRLASVIFSFTRNLTKIKGYLPLKKQLEQIMYAVYDDLKESLVLLAIAIILILIGAFIEANFTIAWGNYVRGML